MAQPPNSQSSPKSKSPTPGIFAAFKSLTTSSKRATASSSSASTPADTSPPTASGRVSDHHLKNFVSNTAATQSKSNGPDRAVPAPKPQDAYIGGPSAGYIDQLVDALQPSNAASDRTISARYIAQYLNEYPALNISGIWLRGKDLVQTCDNHDRFDAGYTLLLACAHHPSLDAVERPLLFDSIVQDPFPARPTQCLAVLNAITRNAKDFEGLDLSRLSSLLVVLLDKSYDLADASRKKSRSDKAASSRSSSTEETTLASVFQFILNAVKFSSFKSFDETYLDVIIDHLFVICKKTRAESDLAHSLEILESVLVYSIFPKACLHACIEVLCSVCSSVDSLKPQTLQLVLQKLLHSYLAADTLSTLQAILRDAPKKPAKERNSIAARGSVQILQEIVVSAEHEAVLASDLPNLFAALDSSLSLSSRRLELDVTNLILAVFKRPDIVQSLLLDERARSELIKVVLHLSAGINFPLSADPLSSSTSNVADKPAAPEKDTWLDPNFIDAFQLLSGDLLTFCENADVHQKSPIMEMLLTVLRCLNDSQASTLIDLYVDERLISPSHEHWLNTCLQVHSAFLADNSKSSVVQLKALKALCNSHSIAAASQFAEAQELAMALLDSLHDRSDPQLVNLLAEFAIDVAIGTSNLENFNAIVRLLQDLLFHGLQDTRPTSRSASAHEKFGFFDGDTAVQFSRTAEATIAKSLVSIFLRSINTSADKTVSLFGSLLAIARSQDVATEARIICLKVLARLRSDINFATFVVADTESEGLAAALCRTADTAVASQETAERTPAPTPAPTPKRENSVSKRKLQSASSSSISAAVGSFRSPSNTGRVTRPTPPMWMYPGPKGLPEDPPLKPSHLVLSHSEPVEEKEEDTEEIVESGSSLSRKSSILKIGLWLELVLDVLQRDELEWETYSYIIVHIGPQLANHSLFVDAIPQIKLLRNVLCDLLQNKKFAEPPAFTNLKKSDVANCLYHVLTILISYHNHFAKSEEDEIVKCFVFGIGSWDRTSEVCIHALSICCHETPMSLVKYLEVALQRMIQIIAQSTIAVHILEFLAGLARLPTLYRNFREEEFKSVFGICFRYLQYVRDQRRKSIQNVAGPTYKSSSALRQTREPENKTFTPSLAELLPQYVYALAYHVMTFWFISLKLQDRARHLAWIRSNLVYTNENGEEEMEEQSQVTVDLMHRVAYSDRDETIPDPSFAKPVDGPVSSKSFLVGLSILTVETAGWTGVSHITIRRPSGTKYTVSRPHVSPLPRHQIPIHTSASADTPYPPDYVGVTPDDVVQNLYSPLSTSPNLASLIEGPIPLPDDEATKRSIGAFDRISALDGHKVGVIYIGENQTSETVILANVMGSADYLSFLNGLGTLTELQGATFNTQGLDREYGSDGKFTYCWRDRVSELVFHVPTMMPTDLERDPQCSLKKRHIGNDYVNIIFNNSGASFKFDTFPSDFNFVNIVITPEARSSFIDTRLQAAKRRKMHDIAGLTDASSSRPWDSSADNDLLYKVTVMTKPGLPKTSPASETKVVSGKSLPSFVRLLALNASVYALVWANRAGGEHVSSWRSRLREIVRLRERNQPTKEAKTNETVSSGGGLTTGNSSSNLQTPPLPAQSSGNERTSGRESGLLRRASAATFFTEAGANRNSGLSTATETEGRNRPSTPTHE